LLIQSVMANNYNYSLFFSYLRLTRQTAHFAASKPRSHAARRKNSRYSVLQYVDLRARHPRPHRTFTAKSVLLMTQRRKSDEQVIPVISITYEQNFV